MGHPLARGRCEQQRNGTGRLGGTGRAPQHRRRGDLDSGQRRAGAALRRDRPHPGGEPGENPTRFSAAPTWASTGAPTPERTGPASIASSTATACGASPSTAAIPTSIFAGTGTPTPPRSSARQTAGRRGASGRWTSPRSARRSASRGFTGFAIDPANPKSIWAGIEVDGLRHSADGGDTWSRVGQEIPNMDLHSVAVVQGPPKRVFAVVNNDAWFTRTRARAGARLASRTSSRCGTPGASAHRRPTERLSSSPSATRLPAYGRDHAVGRHGLDLGSGRTPGRTELRHVGGQPSAVGPRRCIRRQPVRLPVPQRRRRAVVGEDQAGVQRGFHQFYGSRRRRRTRRSAMTSEPRSFESTWGEYGADEWSDAIMASMKLGGVDNLFFVSGSEIAFFQESAAKAREREWPSPRLVTMTHEGAALHAALGNAMVTGQPAGHRRPRRRRYAELRCGHPHGVARRLPRPHDGRHGPSRLSRHDARRPRRAHPVGAGAARPGRDRPPVHQARPTGWRTRTTPA